MTIDLEQIARVCHTANQALQRAFGDPAPSPDWADAPESQRRSAIEGVKAALTGATPRQLHDAWCKQKRAEGWEWGEEKSETARLHPCLVTYDELPPDQQAKDVIFSAIVHAYATGHADGFDEAIDATARTDRDTLSVDTQLLDQAKARFFTDAESAPATVLREQITTLGALILEHVPSGRNQSLALTALEDVQMRGIRGLYAPEGLR